jgi:hypothetical protein
MFQPYPKMLYLRGEVEAEFVIVQDAGEESAKRAEGYRGAWEPEEKATDEPAAVKRKPGRPKKGT